MASESFVSSSSPFSLQRMVSAQSRFSEPSPIRHRAGQQSHSFTGTQRPLSLLAAPGGRPQQQKQPALVKGASEATTPISSIRPRTLPGQSNLMSRTTKALGASFDSGAPLDASRTETPARSHIIPDLQDAIENIRSVTASWASGHAPIPQKPSTLEGVSTGGATALDYVIAAVNGQQGSGEDSPRARSHSPLKQAPRPRLLPSSSLEQLPESKSTRLSAPMQATKCMSLRAPAGRPFEAINKEPTSEYTRASQALRFQSAPCREDQIGGERLVAELNDRINLFEEPGEALPNRALELTPQAATRAALSLNLPSLGQLGPGPNPCPPVHRARNNFVDRIDCGENVLSNTATAPTESFCDIVSKNSSTVDTEEDCSDNSSQAVATGAATPEPSEKDLEVRPGSQGASVKSEPPQPAGKEDCLDMNRDSIAPTMDEVDVYHELDQISILREMRSMECALAEEKRRNQDSEARLSSKIEAQKVAHARDIAELENMVKHVVAENNRLTSLVKSWEEKSLSTASSRSSATPMSNTSSGSKSSRRSKNSAVLTPESLSTAAPGSPSMGEVSPTDSETSYQEIPFGGTLCSQALAALN